MYEGYARMNFLMRPVKKFIVEQQYFLRKFLFFNCNYFS